MGLAKVTALQSPVVGNLQPPQWPRGSDGLRLPSSHGREVEDPGAAGCPYSMVMGNEGASV